MSRTFRRKHYEDENGSSWDRRGTKIGGFYRRLDWLQPDDWPWGGLGWYTFRAPTDQEYFKAYWRNHGDSKTSSSNSPSRWHRRFRCKENRSINNREIHKFMKDFDYEPMCEADPRSCLWDWD